MESPIIREVTIGNCRLIQGDCLAVMPLLGKVDAVVTDPPYGIGADKGKKGAISFKGGKPVDRAWTPHNCWDLQRPKDQIFRMIFEFGCDSIIWGGNYFADLLPPQGKWLWWDKCQTMPTYGDGELAWTNLSGATPKKFTLGNNKILAQRHERFHPTQKPVALMEWCLGFLPKAKTVLDPFMGSGTTGVACVNLGRSFIGIEQDEGYFNIAVSRIQKAHQQADFFVEKPAPFTPTQEGFDL
jgi:DNA modification methylase